MPKFETILYEKVENTAWITLNRPDVRNAINPQMKTDIMAALGKAGNDQAIHVIVITGAGEAFCAGSDVNQFLQPSAADQIARHWLPNPWESIRELAKPVIAMVNGLAFGGGCELILACDICIASENVKLGQLEIRVGIIPGGGATQVLPRLIGEKKAKELIFTGKIITAEEACEIGIVNKVVPQENLRKETQQLITTLCQRSPLMLQIAKMAVNRSLDTTLSAGLAAEKDLFALCFSTNDHTEGISAFLEKRPPKYKGK